MRLLMGITKSRHGSVYYAIKRVPGSLQEAVARVLNNGKARETWLKRSLGTKDQNEANKRAKPVLIEFEKTLERAKQLTARRPLRTSLSPVEIKRMADYRYATALANHDEYLRVAPEAERDLRELDPDIEWEGSIPEFGLSATQIADFNATLPEMLREAQTALAHGDISHIEFQANQVLDAFQINLDRNCPSYRELGLALLRAEVRVLRAIQQRFAGEPIEAPTLPPLNRQTAPTGETLTNALAGWKRQRERSPGTVTEYERAIKLFTELHGDLPVAQIRRNHARAFREALQDVPRKRGGKLLNAPLPELAEWGRKHQDAQKIGAGTVNKLLGGVQAVAVWARDNGVIPDDVHWADPFAKMRLGRNEPVRGGAPFEPEELKAIFGTPVFTAGERPIGGRGDAAYWLPLLALFTGARLGELTSLRASDVTRHPLVGCVCIHITTDAKAGKRLKNRHSERVVPIHPQLIELGFLEYVTAQSKSRGANAWLFPLVAPGTTGTKTWSKWFGRYIRAHGVIDPAKVFHSFRHNFIDALRAAGVAEEINNALAGHSDGSVHAAYGAKEIARRFRTQLNEAVKKVTYEGLDHLTQLIGRAPKSLPVQASA